MLQLMPQLMLQLLLQLINWTDAPNWCSNWCSNWLMLQLINWTDAPSFLQLLHQLVLQLVLQLLPLLPPSTGICMAQSMQFFITLASICSYLISLHDTQESESETIKMLYINFYWVCLKLVCTGATHAYPLLVKAFLVLLFLHWLKPFVNYYWFSIGCSVHHLDSQPGCSTIRTYPRPDLLPLGCHQWHIV